MDMLSFLFSLILIIGVFTGCTVAGSTAGSRVDSITPKLSSRNGGTRITIKGSGFSKNQFNFGDNPQLGNLVTLVSRTRQYECDIHRDGCTQTLITCYTRSMPQGEWFVRVSVDGEKIPENRLCGNPWSSHCSIKVQDNVTPKVYSLSPRTALPGSMLSVRGKLFTDIYATNQTVASNKREVRLVRSYMGGQTCELRDPDTDGHFHLSLDLNRHGTAHTDTGRLDCKLTGSYVGNQNYSFMLDGQFGRSMPNPGVLWVTAQNTIASFQSYAEVRSVTPSVGSTVGGTLLTVSGAYFDDTDVPIDVKIGGAPCAVQEFDDNQIICKVGPKPGNNSFQLGNRGWTLHKWNSSADFLAPLEAVPDIGDAPTQTYSRDWFLWEELEGAEGATDRYVTRSQSYFLPPSHGDYRFYLLADDAAQLWLLDPEGEDNKTLIAYTRTAKGSYRDSNQRSERMTLVAGKPYLLEVYHKEYSRDARVRVAVHMYNTVYKEGQAMGVRNEKQVIAISSAKHHEQQTVTFAGLTTQEATEEIQIINVMTTDRSVAKFRLGMYGVYTAALSVSVSTSALRSALNLLPSIAPETVTVTAKDIRGGRQFNISIRTQRGAWPAFTGVQDLSSPLPVNVSVMSTTPATPSMAALGLSYDGTPAPTVSPRATAKEVQSALTSLFSARCPRTLTSPAGRAYHQTYERRTSYPENGRRVSHVEPLCGRTSLRNPSYIYHWKKDMRKINVFNYPYLCFGYHGHLKSYLQIRHSDDSHSKWATFDVDFPSAEGWQYTCVNLAKLFSTRYPEYTQRDLSVINIARNGTGDLYIDEVYIGSTPPTDDPNFAQYQRLRPAQWIARRVSVTESAPGTYIVRLEVYNCEHSLPLIAVQHAEAQEGDNTTEAVYSGHGWPANASVTVTRTQAVSPPANGTFDIRYKGHQVTGLASDSSPEDLQARLESLPGVGQLLVYREGDCYGFKWTVEWASVPGDQPQMELDASGISGNSVSVSLTTSQDGGVFFDPIPGDLLRTAHSNPQVTVAINHIPSLCSGDCDYSWEDGSTPTVTGVTPGTGSLSASTSLTITGTGFDPTPSSNNVTIGGVLCDVTAATSTELQCDIGEGPAGAHPVSVYVAPKGLARHDPQPHNFTYMFTVSGLSPGSGGRGGGTLLVVSGTGFGPLVTVTVGGEDCPIISSQYDRITCMTPGKVLAGSVSVVVTEGEEIHTAADSFNYDDALTATITSLSHTQANVAGGDVLTIIGSGFDAPAGSKTTISLGSVEVEITFASDGEIVATLPALAPGTYPLRVCVGVQGYAIDSSSGLVPRVVYTLRVTSLAPSRGSVYGGTTLTVTGTGLGSVAALVEVSVGGTQCTVDTLIDGQLTCTLAVTGTTHVVTNHGEHPVYGPGYAWAPQTLQIVAGDRVRWEWSSAELVEGVGYRVERTTSATDREYAGTGFRSEARTRNGFYEYRFSSPGTYYYWSDNVDDDGHTMRGVITVVAMQTTSGRLSVKVGGQEAQYDVAENTDTRRKRAVSCPAVPMDLVCDSIVLNSNNGTTSDDGNTTSSSNVGIMFEFSMCLSATITAISPTSMTLDTAITITGSGFGPELCQNAVTVGGYACVVTAAGGERIVCRLEGEVMVGVPHSVSVDVLGHGAALVDIDDDEARMVTVKPKVSAVIPSSGSVEGGTELVITGAGFREGATSVQVSYYTCDISALNYTHIVCVTRPAMELTEDVIVTVFSNGNFIPAECDNSTCAFSYTNAATPDITDIQPQTITSAGQILTIMGTGFSDNLQDNVLLVGDTPCTIQSATSMSLTCNAGEPIAGAQTVVLHVTNKGYARTAVPSVTVSPGTPALSISKGSLAGGTRLTITGFGFASDSTVSIGGSDCDITSVTVTTIVCSTPPGLTGEAAVVVTSNAITYPSVPFTYDAASTPTIVSISPSSGSVGDSVTITATGMDTDTALLKVTVGTALCAVTFAMTTQVTCTVGAHTAGEYPVTVRVGNQGYATGTVTFTYDLEVSAISPGSGSYGGGQVVTVTGRGFEAELTNVTVCDQQCTNVTVVTSTTLTCVTPLNTGSGSTSCDVTVTSPAASSSLPASYIYDGSLTPQVSGVSPRRGGTGGGTTLTITGRGYGSDPSSVTVTIAGSHCAVHSVADTEIVCTTAEHKPSTTAGVQVTVGEDGLAQETSPGASSFEYIDVWSSPYTWGGTDPPSAGDFVVIPRDMKVLLDVSTPVLKILLIKGGQVVFDEVDVELNAQVILITEGGLLQVGTEESPFQHKATIVLHGHVRDKELPVYGTKVIAVREGTLDLHGQPKAVRWTQLASTAVAGSSQVTVQTPVDWTVGDQIVIATTGRRHSQAQSEQREITAVSGRTLTLAAPLEYEHRGETVTLTGGHVLEVRAEVGLLTHNVVVRGSDNEQWHEVIKACPQGFNTGQFATQTCFQGRFGEEMGSDQFGATIMAHAPRPGEDLVLVRLENVELTHMGQAFRLGRYAVHFHLNGDMPTSYVRGCSIHRSFNRAVNIHATHYVTVAHNVIYDIMGGAVFLEDGIEIGNVFEYNLAVFVKSSTSLQNDDITPAAFWVTNANNTHRHNHVAGGTHFGFWYRMHNRPDGPSFDPNYCPKHIPLGSFVNNTVHSQGWFGIWIFQEFHPMEGGGCWSRTPKPAKFNSLIAYNNEKGAEWVGGGTLQFHDFKVVHNQKAGFEMKMMNKLYGTEFTDNGPLISNSLVVSHAGVLADHRSAVGIIMPYSRGMLVKNTTFLNYDQSSVCFKGTQIDGTTESNAGAFSYVTEALTFVNSPNKIRFRWYHDAAYYDRDGTLCGSADCKVIPHNPSLPPQCSIQDPGFAANPEFPGTTCDHSVHFHRMSFNDPKPKSLRSKNVTFSTQYGTMYSPFKFKRKTHAEGWTVLLVDGESYTLAFENAEHITNVSYDATFYDFKEDDFVIINQEFTQRRPDRFHVFPQDERAESNSSLTNDDNVNGDWFISDDDSQQLLSYIVSSKDDRLADQPWIDSDVALQAVTCFFPDCAPPPDPDTLPPASAHPDDAIYWHDDASWNGTEPGWGGHYGDGTYGPPRAGDDVRIPEGVWMVVTEPLPPLHTLIVDGTLEFESALYENGSLRAFTLSATYIVVHGRLIAGWEDRELQGSLDIVLHGDHGTPEYVTDSGQYLGAKAIGVFGGLDLHGRPSMTSWTHLSGTVVAGDTTLSLERAVDWTPGDEVVIAPSRYSHEETEVRRIATVSSDGLQITLTEGLDYPHYAHTEFLSPSQSYKMSAEVGRLTRNIRIVGGSYDLQDKQAFGARVLVSEGYHDGHLLKGYARLSNVQFERTGQEGWIDWYDPRYSLAFLNLGDITDLRPSYVRSCAFHDGFAPAIGVFSTNLLEVSDTVIHNTVGSSIIVRGVGNSLLRNLVLKVIHPGVYNGREEFRDEWDGGIEVLSSRGTVLVGNAVAGSDRALYRVDGEPCDSAGLWADNTGHSALVGVAVFPGEGIAPCTTIANFTIHRTFDYGLYTQSSTSFKITNFVSIDNQLGLFPMVYSPPARAHMFADKYYELRDSTFIGTSAVMDCEDTLTGLNMELSSQARSWRSQSGGRVGVAFTTFSSSSNNAPKKPHAGIMAYQAINGIMRISGVTFANFREQPQCPGRRDTAITTNPNNDDAQHPVETSGLTLLNVDDNDKVFIHRANLGKVNPSDCVDMECDGLKKSFLTDRDGSLLGGTLSETGGTVVPQSEWAWGGDRRRGLGDYRIPVHMLTDLQGDRLAVSDVAPHKGVVRSSRCEYRAAFQAYVCPAELRYALLHLESMDADTETRRVSPVAVLSEGYMDLVNGPQDHGWCMGYTCQKRLSTFPIMLAAGKSYEIGFTGTTPQDTRYHLLNTNDTFEVILSTWYAASWRLNVFAGDEYIRPTNGYYNDKGQLELERPQYDGQYMPRIGRDPTGTNYYDRASMTLHVLVKGRTVVDIRTELTILVTFNVPYLTVDEFFGERIVRNLASFFDIPADKIKFANAVSESGRRRRSSSTSFQVEIANAPPTSSDGHRSSDLTAEQIRTLSTELTNAYQLGLLGEALDLTITSLEVQEPPPDTASSTWNSYTGRATLPASVKLQIADRMVIPQAPVPGPEGQPFLVPPTVSMLDARGLMLDSVGTELSPWTVRVTLEHSSPDQHAVLGGTLERVFVNGSATFSDLTLSHNGSYKLRFSLLLPATTIFPDLVRDVEIGDQVGSLSSTLKAGLTSTTESMPGADLSSAAEGGLSSTLIIGIATCSAVAAISLILLLVWYFVIRPKTKAAPTTKTMEVHPTKMTVQLPTVMVTDEEFGFSKEILVKQKGESDSGSGSSGVSSANSSSLNLREGSATARSVTLHDGSSTSRSMLHEGSATSMVRKGSATSISGLVSSSLGNVSDTAANSAISPPDGTLTDDIFFGKRLPPIGLISKAKIAARNGFSGKN